MTDPMPTTERLAAALVAASAPPAMIVRARDGYYDDFKSDLELPCIQLVEDLQQAGLMDLRQRAIDGEFDGTPEESEHWMQTEGKHLLSPAMLEALKGRPPQHYNRKPQGFGK